MNKVAVTAGSAVMGVAACFAFVWLSKSIGIAVHFPSPGGEDDFSLRVVWFLIGVCPVFLLLGAWIGYTSFGNAKRWLSMWSGVLIGGIIAFVVARLLQGQIATMTGDRTANYAVFAFGIFWIISCIVGALLMRLRH